MPVRRVLAETDVREQQELRKPLAQRTQRVLDDAVLLPGAGALVVLRLGDAEQDHRLDARRDELLRLSDETLDGVPAHRGQRLVLKRLGRDEVRHDQVREVEARLARERSQRARAAQAPETGGGERAHDRRVRGGARIRALASARPETQA